MEWSEGGEWDNCNSIINKYILKKRQRRPCYPSIIYILSLSLPPLSLSLSPSLSPSFPILPNLVVISFE